MVSHKHRCVFIHIPKCAGTSVDTALNSGLYQIWDERSKYWLQHARLSQIEIPKGYFAFAIVRHPIDRIISSYKFLLKECEGGSFMDFLTASGGFSEILDPELQHEKSNRYHHVMPMTDYIGNGSSLDLVIDIEELKDRWAYICKNLGSNLALEHMNASESWKPELTKEHMAIIKARYSEDYKNFGYA